jgi:DNA-directed RNA polymerase delta subunit
LKRLWGTEKPFAFKKIMVFLLLLKDIKGFLFADLQNEIEDYLLISKKSIEHNVQVIQQELRL